jgi:hypothetical protein
LLGVRGRDVEVGVDEVEDELRPARPVLRPAREVRARGDDDDVIVLVRVGQLVLDAALLGVVGEAAAVGR